MTYSPEASAATRSAALSMPGAMLGRMTRRPISNQPAPSVCAASTSVRRSTADRAASMARNMNGSETRV